jgi:hypothetical protein
MFNIMKTQKLNIFICRLYHSQTFLSLPFPNLSLFLGQSEKEIVIMTCWKSNIQSFISNQQND